MEKHQIQQFYLYAEHIKQESTALRVMTSHYIPVNTWLIRYLGLDAALFLSAAYEELFYLKEIGKIKQFENDVRFSIRKAQMKTGLGEARQRKAIKVLESHNLLRVYNDGWIPTYRTIKFLFSNFVKFENELNDFINKETIKNKKEKEKFNKKMKDIHDGCVNKKIEKQQEITLEIDEMEHLVNQEKHKMDSHSN